MDKNSRKIRALVETIRRGTENEAKNAELLLKKICDKHDVSVEDVLNSSKKTDYPFTIPEGLERDLFFQVVLNLFGSNVKYGKSSRKKDLIFMLLTLEEKIDLDTHYTAYKNAFDEELKIFFSAFIHKHHLFPMDVKPREIKDLTEKEIEDIRKAQKMMGNISDVHVKKQLI